MQLGVAIAVYLLIAIIVMVLFCLITKYFNYRFKKAMEDSEDTYSMVDQISHKSEEALYGEYDEFLNHRKEAKKQKTTSKSPGEEFSIEMQELSTPLSKNDSDIYGISLLKRRLNGQVIPLKPQSSRSRSSASLKSFRPDKINSNRSSKRGDGSHRQDLSKDVSSNITTHCFVNRLVAYNQEGIHTIENDVRSVTLKDGVITEKNVIKNSVLLQAQTMFEDQLELEGFEENEFGVNKYTTTLEIPHMKEGEEYLIKALKTTDKRERVDFSQYVDLKAKLCYDQ